MTTSRADSRMPLRLRRGILRAMTCAGILAALAPWQSSMAQTQSWVPGKNHGSALVAYQDLFIDTHTLFDGSPGFPGTISTHSVFLAFDYGLTDRLALSVFLPYKASRFEGPGKHDPRTLDDDHGDSFIDDGEFHSGWQDWGFNLRYQVRDSPLKVTPFIAYGYPSHDYTTFAHSALGTGQQSLQLGVNIGRQFNPPHDRWYFQAGISYSIMEKVEDRRVNHSTFNFEVGYFLTPRLTANFLLSAQKTHNGFDFPKDYPNTTDDHYYHHDQNLRNDFVNIGAGLSFQLNENYSSFLTYGHSVWGENTHMVDRAITLGFSRSF